MLTPKREQMRRLTGLTQSTECRRLAWPVDGILSGRDDLRLFAGLRFRGPRVFGRGSHTPRAVALQI